MERQIQKPGVRKWFGDDFIKMQDELYKAIEQGVLGSTDNIILAGCSVIPGLGGVGTDGLTPGVCVINKKLCYVPAQFITQYPAYIELQSIETNYRDYADGQNKPTEIHYKGIVSYTQGQNQIQIDTNNTKSRLKQVYIDANGNLKNLPKTDAYNLADSNILTTANALKSLYDLTLRRYFKENFDNGEIDQSSIPDGETWLGKNAPVKIRSNGNAHFDGAIESDAEIIGEVIEANDSVTAGNNIEANNNVEANNNINAGNKVTSNNPALAPNFPKVLIFVQDDAGLMNTLGSVEITNSQVSSGGTGIYNIDLVVPEFAIMQAHVVDNVTYNILAYRHPSTHKPTIEIKDSNNNYQYADFNLTIYY